MLTIYKIGGNVINDPEELKSFLRHFSTLPGKKILVHGGGKEASQLSEKVGLQPKMIEGRRVTDRETLDMVTMVYAGLINKRIVSLLQEFGCDAVGLSGADGNVIPASKRQSSPIDYGYVGDINPQNINTRFISLLLNNGNVPVFCAICRNPEGGLLNCNADSIAGALSIACSKIEDTRLTYCFEKPGVLSDVNNEDSVIPVITKSIFASLVSSGEISGGMIPKVSNAIDAVEKGVNYVRICDARDISGTNGTFIKA